MYSCWCKRQTSCHYCRESITAGEPMLVQLYYVRGTPHRAYYHLHRDGGCCYVTECLDYLREHPYVKPNHPGNGRPALQLSPDDKRKRALLLRRRAAIEHRKRKLLDESLPYDTYVNRLATYETQLAVVYEEIEAVGGAPTKW